MTISIQHLPAELIAEIAAHLDDRHALVFRQVSRHLERSSISQFGRRFFRKKGYLITTSSLRGLEGIAGHNDLSKSVQHVWFNPDCYTFRDTGTHTPEESNVEPDADHGQREAMRECVADHHELLHSRELTLKLTSIFKTLPNLRSIGMRRSEDYRPWGWLTLRDAIGIDPRKVGSYRKGRQESLSDPTLLFAAIIKAVAATEIAILRLYTDAIELDNIPHHVLSEEVLDQACRSLLYLEINIHRGSLKPDERRHISCTSKSDFGEGLLRLFKAAPKLRELGIQIFADAMRSYMLPPVAMDPYSWLKSYPHLTLQKQVENVALKQLQRLKLEKITTSPELLKNLMVPCRSVLTSVKLRDIRLIRSKDSHRPWRSIFEFFLNDCESLSYILLYHLMYEGGGVSFVEHPPTMVGYLDIADDANNPNPPYGETADGEFFTGYDQIAFEASGLEEVRSKLEQIIEGHWYQPPIFSYVMDDALWDTETSDEEW